MIRSLAGVCFYGTISFWQDLKLLCIAPVAQLDRALVFGTKGWGFESLQARHLLSLVAYDQQFKIKF